MWDCNCSSRIRPHVVAHWRRQTDLNNCWPRVVAHWRRRTQKDCHWVDSPPHNSSILSAVAPAVSTWAANSGPATGVRPGRQLGACTGRSLSRHGLRHTRNAWAANSGPAPWSLGRHLSGRVGMCWNDPSVPLFHSRGCYSQPATQLGRYS